MRNRMLKGWQVQVANLQRSVRGDTESWKLYPQLWLRARNEMRYLWCQLPWVDNKHGGAGAVEFIICHAEISIAFVEEKKIPELLKTFPNASKFLKTLVSFEKFTPEQKQQVENFGVKSYSWDEFLQVIFH
nr:long chain acyl-CoA synthetase 5-like isoform X2 [Arachis hypogaea]